MTTKPEKPLYLSPCNGCGQCCLAEQCRVSVIVFGERDLCPALVDAGERYACGLIVHPEKYYQPGHEVEGVQRVGEILGIGQHCDAVSNAADIAESIRATAAGTNPYPALPL